VQRAVKEARNGTPNSPPGLARRKFFFAAFARGSKEIADEVASSFLATPHLLLSPLCGMLPSAANQRAVISKKSPFSPGAPQPMRHTITLYRTAQGWMSKTTDPQTLELFGTDTIPTAFPAAVKESVVLARIQASNPDCNVVVEAQ
jgi:hypothetical protein